MKNIIISIEPENNIENRVMDTLLKSGQLEIIGIQAGKQTNIGEPVFHFECENIENANYLVCTLLIIKSKLQ